MRTPENVNICWNDYESHLCSSVKELRSDLTFSDVTLVCGSIQVGAHKVILASFSLFFRRILHDNPHPHPLIYLANVQMKSLMEILDYMYSGKVEVVLEEVDSLLEMFKEFQIKGFDLQSPKTIQPKPCKRKSILCSSSSNIKREKSSLSWAPDMSMADFSHDEIDNQEMSSSATTWIDQEVLNDMLITSCDEDQLMLAQYESEIDLDALPIEVDFPESCRMKEVDSLIVTSNDKKFKCSKCSYTNNRKHRMKNHIEKAHSSPYTQHSTPLAEKPRPQENNDIEEVSVGQQEVVEGTWEYQGAQGGGCPGGRQVTGYQEGNHHSGQGGEMVSYDQDDMYNDGSGTSTQGYEDVSMSASGMAGLESPKSLKTGKSGVCPWCHKSMANLKTHMEDVHFPIDTPCPLCAKVFTSKNKMFQHKYRACPNRITR